MKAFFFILFIFLSSSVSAVDYPDTFRFVEVPDPLSGTNSPYYLIPRACPSAGETIVDYHFGTIQVRSTMTDGIKGRHEYSRFDPFNISQSAVILDPEALWSIYSTASRPFNIPSNLLNHCPLSEPRWDGQSENIIWGIDEYKIMTFNVSTGALITIKDFQTDPDISPLINNGDVFRITTRDEGEASRDRRYWAFILQGNASVDYRPRYIFTWDRTADSVMGIYEVAVSEADIDWVGMSWLGNFVLIGGMSDNTGNIVGLTMSDKTFSFFHRLDYTTSHADVGLDVDGDEVIIMQNNRTDYIDLIPIDTLTEPILVPGGSYSGTNRTPLMILFYNSGSPYGLNSGVHISSNYPGFAVVSTTIEPSLPEQNWLDRTVTLVRLDEQNPRVFYLSKLYNTTGAYWEETHATITDDGSKIVWADNWSMDVGQERVFLMELLMPEGWPNLTFVEETELKENSAGLSVALDYFCRICEINIFMYDEAFIDVKIFNVAGELVNNVFSGRLDGGELRILWNMTDKKGCYVKPGVYFVRLSCDKLSITEKVVMMI